MFRDSDSKERGVEPSALMEEEVLTLSDEASIVEDRHHEHYYRDLAQVLAIKAGLAIPWNRMR